MPELIVPEAMRVSILGNQADGPFASVYGIHIEGEAVGVDAIAQAVLNAWRDEVLPHLCSTVVLQRALYVDLRSGTGDSGEVIPTGPGSNAGGVTTAPCPPQVTYLVKLKTTGGRSARNGRSFLPGVRGDEVNNRGDITSGTVDTITDAMESFRGAITDADAGELGVIHRPSAGSPSITDVQACICEGTIATQRRRLRR